MSQCWFRPKTYGYGATPTNWKGWAAVAVYVAAVLVLTLPMMVWPAEMPAGPKIWQVVTWALMVTLLTLGLIHFARAKTDGQWSWRWGR